MKIDLNLRCNANVFPLPLLYLVNKRKKKENWAQIFGQDKKHKKKSTAQWLSFERSHFIGFHQRSE